MIEGSGGTPPAPAGYVPPTLPGLAAGAFAGIFRGRQVVISGTGPGAGLFVYNGTPAAGNLPVFCVVAPGTTTDPFGNGITAIVEIGQQSGGHWHWDLSGNLDINNTSSQLIARWRPTDQALLFYSPGGGLGNLLTSLAAAAGTDQDGNPFVAGFGGYLTVGGVKYAISLGSLGSELGIQWVNQSMSLAFNPGIHASGTAAGSVITLTSGTPGISGIVALLVVQDPVLSGFANGTISLKASRAIFGVTGNAYWDDVSQNFNLPAGGGPFVTGETFHTVSGAAGLTGTIRIRKTPWNMVYLDVLVSWTATVATTFTCGSLPDATYYPTVNDPGNNTLLPMASNAAWTTDTQARVFIPTSGAIQVIVGASSAGGNGCFRGFYATN